MDFITNLPSSHGYSTIMVIVDRLSKFGHFIALKAEFNSKLVANVFINNAAKIHGFPKSIVSDRDRVFINSFWQQLFKAQGTTLAMSSSYHPQSDGQTKILNKTLEMYLRCFVFDNPKLWYPMLAWAQYWYNSSYHHSLGMSPFKVVFGREPPAIVPYQVHPKDPISLQETLVNRDNLLQKLKGNLARAHNYMKMQAYKKRRDFQLEVGDLALVKLQPYRQQSVALRKNQKLGMHFFGPFEVVERVGQVAYKLKLPEAARIHPVFHISLLKQFQGSQSQQYLPMSLTTTEFGPIIQPEHVLDTRIIKRNGIEIQQILIQWESFDASEASWEDLTAIKQSYPRFNLEDKVDFKGKGIVTSNSVGDKCVGNSIKNDGHMESDPQNLATRRSTRAHKENVHFRGYDH